jgi:hypothetical protein
VFVFAHLGHWYIQLIYAGPLLALVIIGLMQRRHDKRPDARRGPDRKRG